MADPFTFSLISPEKTIAQLDAHMVILPGSDGDLGILAHHSPLIITLRPGVVRVYQENEISHLFFVKGGFAEIKPASTIGLITEGKPLEELEKQELENELQALLQELKNAKSTEDSKKIEQKLKVVRAQIDGIEYFLKKTY